MTTEIEEPAPSGRVTGWRGEVARVALTAGLVLATLLPVLLGTMGPPARPRVTLFGLGDELSLLVEGAGGGRLVVGGGATRTALGAGLGRFLLPWDRRIDLLLLTAPRDAAGAIELVRQDGTREVALIERDEPGGESAALAALRAICAERGVPLRRLVGDERIRVGAGIVVELGALAPEGAAFRIRTGALDLLVADGPPASQEPAPVVVLRRGGQEAYRAALGSPPELLVAPVPPPATSTGQRAGGNLLVVGTGQRATFVVEARALRLRGPAVQPLGASLSR